MKLSALSVAALGAAPPANAPHAAIPVCRVDEAKYSAEGNIARGPHAATTLDMLFPKGMKRSDGSLATAEKKYPGVIMFHADLKKDPSFANVEMSEPRRAPDRSEYLIALSFTHK